MEMEALSELTLVNDGVIDLDNQSLRNPISDVELSSAKLSNDVASEPHSCKHPGLAGT